jgi:hypothetical protein
MTAARDGSPPPKAFLGRRCIAFGREKEVDRRSDSGWMRPLSCFTHWPQIHCSSGIAIIFSIHSRWQTFHFSRNFGRIERNTHNAIGISERPGSVALPTDRLEIRERYSLTAADFDLINRHRTEANRLGFAIQLCLLRYPGRSWLPAEQLPSEMLRFYCRTDRR